MNKISIIILVIISLLTGCNKQEKISLKKNNIVKQPKFTHYTLAHQLIPSLFFSNPNEFMNQLEIQHEKILYDFTNPARHKIPLDNSIKNKKLHYKKINNDKYRMIIIKLPKPRKSPHAYYVAAVENKKKRNMSRFRYFTLEKSLSIYKNKKIIETILCEWTKDNKHRNFGIGTKSNPSEKDFIKLIEKKLHDNRHMAISHFRNK